MRRHRENGNAKKRNTEQHATEGGGSRQIKLTIRPPGKMSRFFDRISSSITRAVGRPIASVIAIVVVLAWAFTGPALGFSETWQLLINTFTTVITFLMVFIIQQSQNKDTLAVQLKLNELIAAHERASNRLIDVEDLTSEELEVLKRFYVRLSELAERERDLLTSHSVEEAANLHASKHGKFRKEKAKE